MGQVKGFEPKGVIPATLEGAVRSGFRAAEAALGST